jgi:uroporphyrin-III C-methyltransferase
MTVHLVGAGPGDPDLLTVAAARLLASADVVVHDRLISDDILRLAPDSAELVDVGKRPGRTTPQDLINALLVHLGSQGLEVVRLKGGDPYVFGRGGEEAEALRQADIPFTVVPGITSAIAAPAAAGIPVTHRNCSAAFTVVTGHRTTGGATGVAWEALAEVGGTIVVLMGVAERATIASRLMAGGLDPATPVAAVRHGTRSDQEVVRTTLAGLGDTEVRSPATIVIGAVAAFSFDSPALQSPAVLEPLRATID